MICLSGKEKKARMRSFERRLRKERREQVISKKHDFDYLKWQNDFETLLKREEESYATNVTVRLTNLLVVNTVKVKCQLTLDNKAIIDTQLTLGLQPNVELTCQLCKMPSRRATPPKTASMSAATVPVNL